MASKRLKFTNTQLSQQVGDWGSEDEDFDLSQIDLSMTTTTSGAKSVHAHSSNEQGAKKAEYRGM
jgi:hypothetical protein